MPLADYQQLVSDLVRDDAGKVSTTQRDAAISQAVERFSRDRPRVVAEDMAGLSGHVINLPGAWEDGFSELRSLEHPVGQVPPSLIAPEGWAPYLDVSGQRLMLANALATGSTVRATLTVRHLVGATQDTIPAQFREAVAKAAAAILCDQLAAVYANDSDSTISADHVAGQSRSQAWAARARDYRKQYQDQVGVPDKAAMPAGVVVQLKATDSLGGARFFHPARGQR